MTRWLPIVALGCAPHVRPPRPGLAGAPEVPAAPIDPAVAASEPGLDVPRAPRPPGYSGALKLRVQRARPALDAVVAAAQARGGHLEHLTDDRVVVRVPVAAFRETWDEVLALGEVVSQSRASEVVTEGFFAVDLRIRTLTLTRDRLAALRRAALDEAERLALVHELQRVNEQLERLERQRRTLLELADSSLLTVEVVQPVALAAGAERPPVAGFGWIDVLTPFQRSLGEGDRVPLQVPEGMVEVSPRGPFVAESPEGAALWTSRLPNEPRAEGHFWIDAVIDRIGGEFDGGTVSTRGAWTCVRFVDRSEAPYTWEVCAASRPDDPWLRVAQVSTAEAAGRYGAAVAASLGGEP